MTKDDPWEALAGIALGILGGMAAAAILKSLSEKQCPHCQTRVPNNQAQCPICGWRWR